MLTFKQMKTYKFVRDGILTTGRAPTYRRIAAEIGEDVSSSYNCVTRICERGWLVRRERQIILVKRLERPTTTDEFDYFTLDYKHPMKNGWPRLIGVSHK